MCTQWPVVWPVASCVVCTNAAVSYLVQRYGWILCAVYVEIVLSWNHWHITSISYSVKSLHLLLDKVRQGFCYWTNFLRVTTVIQLNSDAIVLV